MRQMQFGSQNLENSREVIDVIQDISQNIPMGTEAITLSHIQTKAKTLGAKIWDFRSTDCGL